MLALSRALVYTRVRAYPRAYERGCGKISQGKTGRFPRPQRALRECPPAVGPRAYPDLAIRRWGEWDLQLCHWQCNRGTGGKHDKITPRALALAAKHGIVLMPAAA